MDRVKLDARSADLQFCAVVDGDIGFEAANVIQVEALAEEVFAEDSWRIKFSRQLVVVIAPGVETRVGIQGPEIRLSANVVPMGMCNEDGGQFRQTSSVRTQRFVGRPGGVRPRAGVNADQLS